MLLAVLNLTLKEKTPMKADNNCLWV